MSNLNLIKPACVQNIINKFCFTIGMIPTSYKLSLTYEEQILAIGKYLEETVYPAINNNAAALAELQELFINLHDYVYNYFDNLDVQTEIDNKLDEMVKDGTLQGLLEEILHALKIYDTVQSMKVDNELQNNQKVYCFGYNTIGDIGYGYYYITNQEGLTVDNITVIPLENGLFAKLLYTNIINVPDVTIITHDFLAYCLNNNITIHTLEPIPVTETVNITNSNINIQNMNFDIQGSSNFGLLLQGNNIIVKNNRFTNTTPCVNHVRVQHENNKVLNNLFIGTSAGHITTVCVISAKRTTVSENTFINTHGFTVQTLWSKEIIITNNTFDNYHTDATFTALGGETVIHLNVEKNQRRAIKINDTFLNQNSYTYNYDDTTKQASISLNNALSAGDILYFRGYESLEMLNINSNSVDVTISNNIIKGSGDSGIAVGSDYKGTELDPTGTTSVDYPRRINITNNVISDIAFAGVAINNEIKFVTIENNVISNCGWLTDGLFSSGIITPYAVPASICNNNISNQNTTELTREDEDGIMINGITITPNKVVSANTYLYQKRSHKLMIKNNAISNVTYMVRTHPNENGYIQVGLDSMSDRNTIFPELNGVTTSTGIYQLGGTASCSLDTEENIDSVNSMKVSFSSASDQWFQFTNKMLRNLVNYKVHLSFWAKASDTNKQMQVLYNSAQVNHNNFVQQFLTTDWQLYEMDFEIGQKPTTLLFRASSGNTAGNVWLSHINCSIHSLNDLA